MPRWSRATGSRATGSRATEWCAVVLLGIAWSGGVVLAAPPVTDAATFDRAQPLDLSQAVALALQNNPRYLAELERRNEVAGGVEEVRADAFPQFDLVSSWSRSRSPTLLNSSDFDDFIDQFPDFQPGEQELWDLGVQVSQPIYSGGKVKAAQRLAESVVEVTEAQVAAKKLDIALTAAESFYALLASEQALQAVISQEESRRAALDVVEVRFELEEATRLEWLQARSVLAAVGPRLAAARGRVQVAQSQLRLALGLGFEDEGPIAVAEPASQNSSERPPSILETDLRALMVIAKQERPELQDLELQLEALDHQRQIKVAGGRPQVDLHGRYAHQVSDLDNLHRDGFADWLAVVGLRWSFYDGGRRKGQVAQLESLRQQLIFRRQDLLNQISSDLASAVAELHTAKQRLKAAEVSVEVAREARRVALESYRQGIALQADLVAAQDSEIQAELERVAAFYGQRVRAAQLRRTVGRLPTDSLGATDSDRWISEDSEQSGGNPLGSEK